MKKAKKQTHGGSGRNQGRHLKYGEPTEMISGFYCPKSKVSEMKLMIAAKLAGWLPKNSS